MFSKKLSILFTTALLALQTFVPIYAATHIEPDFLRAKPGLPPPSIKAKLESPKFQKKLQRFQETYGKQKTSQPGAFDGWWQNTIRGNNAGFGEPPFGSIDDLDSYIFIDSVTLERFGLTLVTTFPGTPVYPREFTNVDYGPTQEPSDINFYYQPNPDELVEVLDLDGPFFNPVNGQSWWSLKLQPDGTSLCASIDSRPEYIGYLSQANFFKKIDAPWNPIRPFDDTDSAFPDVTNPVAIAQYMYNSWTLNSLNPENNNFKDTDYKSFYEREAIFAQLIDEGFTFITPIRRIRVSQPGEHFISEFSRPFTTVPNNSFVSSDKLTDIFTDGFSYATTGATVEIGGFEGPWACMNGIYVNGVAIDEENAIPNPSPTHVDVNEDQTKGTFRNVYNHFLLNFDSSDAKKFPRDNEGWAKGICGKPYVKVIHRITPDTEYPALFGALQSMFYQMYQVSFHTARFKAIFKPGSMFLVNTWQEMKDAVATNNYWGSPADNGRNQIASRDQQAIPSGFFNNAVLANRTVTTYNDPFGLTQAPGSKYDYNIVMANYLDQNSVKNLYWAIAGTPATNPGDPTAPNGQFLQFDPVDIGYKPVIPGTQRAEFVGALGNVIVTDGIPKPQNPDPEHFTLLGDFFYPTATDTFVSNNYYVGFIDPALTGDKRIGYLRWGDEGLSDPSFFMITSTFPPVAAQLPPSQGGTNLKYGREAISQVMSNYTRYFNQQNCDAVILDIRANNGGIFEDLITVAEFFGDDRASVTLEWSKKDNGNSDLVQLDDSSQFQFFQNVIERNATSLDHFYVQQNAATYGADTICRGSPGKSKKVIVLTDYGAASSGDIFPHLFLGENLDGNLGSNTTGIIIGDIDGRLKGAAASNPLPVSKFANRIYDAQGRPFSPIDFTTDTATFPLLVNGRTGSTDNPVYYNQQSNLVAPSEAPTLHGTAGGNPLPNDWETNVWPALGLIKAPKGLFDPGFPKGKPNFDKRTSWRDPWLEQAILAAIGQESDSSSSPSSCQKKTHKRKFPFCHKKKHKQQRHAIAK